MDRVGLKPWAPEQAMWPILTSIHGDKVDASAPLVTQLILNIEGGCPVGA